MPLEPMDMDSFFQITARIQVISSTPTAAYWAAHWLYEREAPGRLIHAMLLSDLAGEPDASATITGAMDRIELQPEEEELRTLVETLVTLRCASFVPLLQMVNKAPGDYNLLFSLGVIALELIHVRGGGEADDERVEFASIVLGNNFREIVNEATSVITPPD